MRAKLQLTRRALKTATQEQIEEVGGTQQAARLLGVGVSTLSKYASLSEEWENNFIRIDLAFDLDRRSPKPQILSTLACELGFSLVQDFAPDTTDLTLCPFGLLKLDRVLDDVIHEVADAIADGHADALERKEILKRIASAEQHLAKLKAMVQIGGGA